MSVTIFDLPKNILFYMFDTIDRTRMRATCRTMRDIFMDSGKEYRKCKTFIHVLEISCNIGQLDVAQWCVSIDLTGVLKQSKYPSSCTWLDSALYKASEGGHLDIAKWCVTNGATDIDWAARCASAHNHYHVTEWCNSIEFEKRRLMWFLSNNHHLVTEFLLSKACEKRRRLK